MHVLADRLADPDLNVVLTGFMGTGKSTTGRRLAGRLGFDFVDTDDLFVARHGPIAEFFETDGEDRFREVERDLAAEVSGRRRHVVATGGRTLLDPANEATLGASGRCFCLWATTEEILGRVRASRSGIRRPLLETADPEAAVTALLAQRLPRYRRFPMVATGGLETRRVADDLARLVATRPSVTTDGGRTTIAGIGIAAMAARCPVAATTVIDVGRIQPARGLRAGELLDIQTDLVAALGASQP